MTCFSLCCPALTCSPLPFSSPRSNPKGYMMHLPQGGLRAGMDRRKVVMCPRRGKDPASGHFKDQSRVGERTLTAAVG